MPYSDAAHPARAGFALPNRSSRLYRRFLMEGEVYPSRVRRVLREGCYSVGTTLGENLSQA